MMGLIRSDRRNIKVPCSCEPHFSRKSGKLNPSWNWLAFFGIANHFIFLLLKVWLTLGD
jgi:hypothetical protein